MTRPAIILGVGLLSGCGLGYAIGVYQTAFGQLSSSARNQPALAAPPVAPPAPPPAKGPAGPSAAANDTTKDQAQIVAWLAAQGPLRDWPEINRCLTRWARADPWAALAFVHQAPRFPERANALCIPLSFLARSAPASVADWLRTQQPAANRKELATQVIASICDENPHEALALARADQIPVETNTLGYVLGCLAQREPAQAALLFSGLASDQKDDAAERIGRAWAEKDPDSALRWCDKLRGQPGEDLATRGVLSALADRDAKAAGAALERLLPSAETIDSILRQIAYLDATTSLLIAARLPAAQQRAAAKAVVEATFGTAPDRALALARANLPAPEFTSIVTSGWQEWRRSDRPAAEAWAANLADPSLLGLFADVQLQESANADPALFLSCLATLPTSNAESPAIEAALSNLPADVAARWITDRPDAVAPAFAARIAANYFRADREAATLWAHSLPPGTARDRALATTAQTWIESGDTATAALTVEAIADPRLQTAARFQIFSTLCQQDRPGALRWLATQPVSPEVRINWEILATEGTAPTPLGPSSDHCD